MADDELMELDVPPLGLENLFGSLSTFLAPPLLGTNLGRSKSSSSSGRVLEPLNLDTSMSSSEPKLSSTGFLR